MSAVALVLYVVAMIVLFGVRSWVQRRRTGSTGFHGVSGPIGSAAWWGGALFVAAMALGVAGPLLAVTATVPIHALPAVQALGIVVALLGFAATLAGQSGMGASWRIGVDPAERTELVTTGVFAHVRNPIFTAMVVAQTGVVLTVPSWVSGAALVALIVAVQLQVRAVEEPYLRAAHGRAYASYCAHTGRFLPAVSRHGSAEPAGTADPAASPSAPSASER